MKLKGKVLISVLVIALAAALIGGGIMAWFTSSANIEGISFTTGTVELEANKKASLEQAEFANVNPGDAYCVGWDIKNTGSKGMALRLVAGRRWDFGLGEQLADPAHIAICPNYQDDWKIIPTVAGFEVYYVKNDGRIEPADTVTLVLVVAFEGPGMGDDFQDATFTLSGDFEAVQTTHGAPLDQWGENWNADHQPDEYFDGFTTGDWPECCGLEPEPVITYTVTFDSQDGDAVASIGGIVEGGMLGDDLPTPTRSGFEFVGWFQDEGCTQPFTESTPINDNITVYAKWVEVITNCTVTFDPVHENGTVNGQSGVYNLTVSKGSKIDPLPTATRPGNHPFKGWYTQESGGTQFTTSTIVNGNITLYAHYN